VQLPNIEVIVALRRPAQERIAFGLHEPLALDDALTVPFIATPSEVWREN
jgi:hypothetical protein